MKQQQKDGTSLNIISKHSKYPKMNTFLRMNTKWLGSIVRNCLLKGKSQRKYTSILKRKNQKNDKFDVTRTLRQYREAEEKTELRKERMKRKDQRKS